MSRNDAHYGAVRKTQRTREVLVLKTLEGKKSSSLLCLGEIVDELTPIFIRQMRYRGMLWFTFAPCDPHQDLLAHP